MKESLLSDLSGFSSRFTYLILHFLLTGERLDLGRLRCKDVLPSGQRMTVWFSPMGFDFASVSDEWKSAGIGLSVMSTPRRLK